MRPLNRPMFKYGGPIKEGIMNGMKEKQAINTVGSPLAPKDETGRGGYAIPLLAGAGMAALRFLPAAYRGFKAARLGSYAPMSQNLGVAGRLKNIFGLTSGIKAPMAPAGAGAGFRVGSFLKQNPLTALPIAGTAIEGVGRAGVGLAKMSPDLLKQYANQVIPFADPFTIGEKAEPPTGDGTGLKRGDGKTTNVGDITGTTKPGTAGGTTVKSDAEKQQINEDRINETKQKYYKLMGIDKMNKDAVYNSLIDASKIVSEEGADLKGSIRSGNLQNRIIQAISQNLDKSADLKKQIDAAVLKGEIEKDIKASDPSAAVELDYKKAATAKIKKDLEGSSVADVLATAEIGGKNLVTSNTLTSILSSKGTNVDFTFPDDKYQKWEKNNENKDEIDYLQENYGGLDDGLYVVNKKAVQVKDGQATFVDLDKITG
tara:strand:+ start:14 stop:1303 length:1290 start_codon:yes stop_codon:yes gene_type:complete